MNLKKVLVLGASGAMGKYLVPKLAARGYQVDAVALDDYDFGCPVNQIKAQAKDFAFRTQLLKNNYDGIIDFLTYPSSELVLFLPELLESTEHYIYLSSYRVYDGCDIPITENSSRLLDSSRDVMLKNSDDYSIYKARGENILKSWKRKNWSIIRPTITYSLMRYQLVTLESGTTVARAKLGKTVVLPETAKNVNATMSWAGDVAEMIARLLFNEKALGETFTTSTSEYHTWGEIADYYKDICNLKAVWVDKEDYLAILNPYPYKLSYRWQLEYARLFDREVDNSKVLAVTGLKQEDMMPLYDGLKMEIDRTPRDYEWRNNQRMDDYLATLKK